jgi:hypothetical protein
MKHVLAGLVALGVGTSPAVAAKFTMQLKPAADQSSRMFAGVAAVDAHKVRSSVRLIQLEGDLKKRGTVQIIVMNHGDQPFDFGPENVTSRLADGTAVAVIPYDQLAREEKSRQTWRAVAAGLASMNSGRYSANGNYSGSSFGSVGTTSYSGFHSGTATVSGRDPTAAAIENRRIFDNLAARNAAGREALVQNIRTTTVDPQQMFGGSVTIELPKSVHKSSGDVPMTFVVEIAGEEHKFDAVLKRR